MKRINELLLDELQQLKNTTQVNGAQKEQEEIPAKNEVVQKSEVVTKEGQLIPSAVLQSISRIENKVLDKDTIYQLSFSVPQLAKLDGK